MMCLRIYRKDMNKKDTDFIIVTGFEGSKKTYYISTRQAVKDFYEKNIFTYKKACYDYKLAKKLLAEMQK